MWIETSMTENQQEKKTEKKKKTVTEYLRMMGQLEKMIGKSMVIGIPQKEENEKGR